MEYRNKKVLVIGLARSGMAAIKVLHQLGAQIYLSERKAPSENEIKELEEMGVTIYDQDMSVFEKDYDLVIKNPGVPPVSPIVKRLNERNIRLSRRKRWSVAISAHLYVNWSWIMI